MVHASDERNSLIKVLHFGEYHNATKPQVSFTLPNVDILVAHSISKFNYNHTTESPRMTHVLLKNEAC